MFKDKESFFCELGDFQLKREDKNRKIRIYNATLLNFETLESKLKDISEKGRVGIYTWKWSWTILWY